MKTYQITAILVLILSIVSSRYGHLRKLHSRKRYLTEAAPENTTEGNNEQEQPSTQE